MLWPAHLDVGRVDIHHWTTFRNSPDEVLQVRFRFCDRIRPKLAGHSGGRHDRIGDVFLRYAVLVVEALRAVAVWDLPRPQPICR